MSKFLVSEVLELDTEIEQMKYEVKQIIDLVGWVCGGTVVLLKHSRKWIRIWEEGNRHWEVHISNGKLGPYMFRANGTSIFSYACAGDKGESPPRYYCDPSNIVEVRKHLQQFLDGMEEHFGEAFAKEFSDCQKLLHCS